MPNKQNIGNAGEYYIASLLSALDFTVTRENGPGHHEGHVELSRERRELTRV